LLRTVAALGIILVFATTAAAQENPFGTCPATDLVFAADGDTQPVEGRPNAFLVTLTGTVHIPCGDTALWADRVVYETDTRLLRADGNVLFQQGALQIFADRAELNTATRLGVFFDAWGLSELGSEPAEKSLFGTQEPHVHFEAERIEKAGADEYLITNGRFTTCVQATPRWEMHGSQGKIRLDRYALLRNVQLRVKGVPLLYLPAIYYPINKEGRATGFLLPSYGSRSSTTCTSAKARASAANIGTRQLRDPAGG
jgi:lipopolysaccharide assembly outer membrane protein LptD (OstA)